MFLSHSIDFLCCDLGMVPGAPIIAPSWCPRVQPLRPLHGTWVKLSQIWRKNVTSNWAKIWRIGNDAFFRHNLKRRFFFGSNISAHFNWKNNNEKTTGKQQRSDLPSVSRYHGPPLKPSIEYRVEEFKGGLQLNPKDASLSIGQPVGFFSVQALWYVNLRQKFEEKKIHSQAKIIAYAI